MGGLGNQMFQYSFYLALQKQFKRVKADLTGFEDYPLHNGFELHNIFRINLKNASKFDLNIYGPQNRHWVWRKLRRLYQTKYAYTEETISFGFDKAIFSDKRNRYYWGYWQHIDYVNRVAKDLRVKFRFPEPNGIKNIQLIQKIKQRNSVSLHIRRGDYLLTANQHLGNVCDITYYKKAITYIKSKIDNPLFIVFSNDISWCRETFKDIDAVFVDWNTGKESYIDMQLMSLCQHNIIANSSFSWWGAWLNNNLNKIIVSPNKWINETRLNTDGCGLILDTFITF